MAGALQTIPPLSLPRHAIQQRFRPAGKAIPQTPAERSAFLQFVRHYVAEFNPVPPLPLGQVREHAQRAARLLGCDRVYVDYLAVLVNNEMWREAVASVPYEKRLLLLPKCLRVESKCPAPFDEFGLLCKQCGLCAIQDLQAEAERLGYAVMVAEGSAVVTALIQTGKIEAIVGVSCLGVLERAFPHMEAAAIPGIAIPLLQDGCADTTVDLDWVWDYIHLTSADQTRRLDLGRLREQVDAWFGSDALDSILGPAEGETERLGRQWLARGGKRWRPFLAVAAFQALRSDKQAPLPADLRRLAVAVECFHKASLIHDDIEDNDLVRYGQPTLHAQQGLEVALNVGDLLIGEGYRLLADCELPAEAKVRMVAVAAQGQRQLCRGQGAELCWSRFPRPLTPAQVLEIFRQKTAPAFEVALKLGALYAEGYAHSVLPAETPGALGKGGVHALDVARYAELCGALEAYSTALGIAYQIRDDLEDSTAQESITDGKGMHAGLLLALAYDSASPEKRHWLQAVWRPSAVGAGAWPKTPVRELLLELKADEQARTLLETYKEEAIRSLGPLENPNLKGLLRRVIGRIFNGTEIRGWCKEVERLHDDATAGDAAGGRARA